MGNNPCLEENISHSNLKIFFFNLFTKWQKHYDCSHCSLGRLEIHRNALTKLCSPIFATSAQDSHRTGKNSILPHLLSLSIFLSLFRTSHLAKGFPLYHWWNHRTCHVYLHNSIHSKIEINFYEREQWGCVQTSWFQYMALLWQPSLISGALT